jgi:hypothetical protein
MKNRLNAPLNAKNRPKKEVDYYTPKRAFDQVIEHYPEDAYIDLFGSDAERNRDRERIAAALPTIIPFYEELPRKNKKGRTQGVIAAKGTPVKNTTAPSLQDFKVDVQRVVRKVITMHEHKVKFIKRYLFGMDDMSKDDQYLFAGFEQRIGSAFIRHKIYPLNRYFISIRKEKQSK